MAVVQTIMESREKAGPSERPNMQSANVFKGFTNRASGGANVYWAQGEGIGRPHVWMCQPGNAPPSQKCLCVLPWQQLVCWRKLMSLWMCFWGEGRRMGWWRERRRHFCPTGNETSCAHTAAGQTLMNSFTHSLTYTLSHKNQACFPIVSPNQHPSFFFFLSFICPHISAIYFCLYSVSSSIITGTTGD